MFSWFKKRREEPAKPERGLYDLCYGMAYYLLPDLLFSDARRLIRYFHDPDYPAGPFLYVLACQAQNVEPIETAVRDFKTHIGRLSDGRDYYVLEYPMPPQSGSLGSQSVFPYFSAILCSKPSEEFSYYILGQHPFGGTTLRTAYPDGSNANLGPGPLPELAAFVQALETVDPSKQTVAVHKFRNR